MGAKFREKRKLPSEINFVVLNFVPKTTFADCSDPIIMPVQPQKFADKTFTDGLKP